LKYPRLKYPRLNDLPLRSPLVSTPWRCLALATTLLAAGCAASSSTPSTSVASSVATSVDFVNASRPTRCAEEDNVYVTLAGPEINAFRVRAEHPPYVGDITTDLTAPDFTACDMSNDPSFAFEPRTTILYEDESIRLVGHRFGSFWRPEVVDFKVGTRHEPGLHLVQLLRRGIAPGVPVKGQRVAQAGVAGNELEILVVYPADGYWRAKPLPPVFLDDTAYGSSFLIGPIAEDGRPYVAIREIEFEPATQRFLLHFRDGSRGTVTVTEATRSGIDLSVTLDTPLPADRPFAALRSMFVTSRQADVAVAVWPQTPSGQNAQAPIMDLKQIRAPSARFGRIEPSTHNLSAPDMVFDRFSSGYDIKLRDR
jgi:hypothetical protein